MESPSPGPIVLFFFFSRGSGQQNHAKSAIGTLIDQLISHEPSLHDVLQSHYNTYHKKGNMVWTWNLLWILFLDMVHNVREHEHFYIVLDALDECNDDAEDDFMHFILSLADDFGNRSDSRKTIKVFVTARRQENIIDMISPQQHFEISTQDTRHDISSLIETRVEEVAARRSLSTSVAQTISIFLKDRAEGMFLWVELIIKELMVRDKPLTDESIALKLNTLPMTLASTYEKVLQEIPDSRRREFWTIMRWLIYRQGRMSIEQLEEFLCREMNLPHWHDFTGDLNFVCRFFIKIEDGKVDLIHQTARDFLIGYIGTHEVGFKSDGEIDMTSAGADMHLAAVCIEKLLDGDRLSFIGWGYQSMTEESWNKHVVPLVESSQAFSYAAEYWATHLSKVISPGSALLSLTLKLLDSQPKRDALIYLNYYFRFSRQKGSPYGPSRLHLACYFDLPWLVKYCIEQGDDVNAIADARDTPLIWAAEMGSFDCVQKLLDARADPNQVEFDGWSALHWVAVKGYANLCRLLLENNAETDLMTFSGHTCLDWAIYSNQGEIVDLLRRHNDSISK